MTEKPKIPVETKWFIGVAFPLSLSSQLPRCHGNCKENGPNQEALGQVKCKWMGGALLGVVLAKDMGRLQDSIQMWV